MKRTIIIGLVGLALVSVGAVWAWLQMPAEAPAVQTASVVNTAGPPTPAEERTARASLEAPPIIPVRPPSFDVVRINPAGDAVIAGRADP
ncbi:MAG: peptidoglycan-binding protein, partial [Rhodospirillales bacterium]|nr:peptidoglycan-binding protein [Rhodospirillales bacterium]